MSAAVIKASKSPFITASTLPVSCPVRKSFTIRYGCILYRASVPLRGSLTILICGQPRKNKYRCKPVEYCQFYHPFLSFLKACYVSRVSCVGEVLPESKKHRILEVGG
ncbi:hypothetical protein ANAPC5_00553 [Anaplasma phagocytophilum]|nr:hypothetical protein ANAPC2_01288 [Anaplasma phagocytophilum]SBO33672.1 hypothetical protein ANAPC3_01314 [Anaplasma phagocytophilum]SBO33777.1 hypothetical protein ANAPC4_01290 [Anaplasma phagocytophilum]SCV63395.1 hypothetical protein ANAPC5_00553 [Anaplasma phagocytophilum]